MEIGGIVFSHDDETSIINADIDIHRSLSKKCNMYLLNGDPNAAGGNQSRKKRLKTLKQNTDMEPLEDHYDRNVAESLD